MDARFTSVNTKMHQTPHRNGSMPEAISVEESRKISASYHDRVILYFSLSPALYRVNFHSMVVLAWLVRLFHAVASVVSSSREAILRLPGHSRLKSPISISARLRQLPCFGVWWTASRNPQPASICFAEPVRSRLAGMGREVVEHQVDGVGGGVGRGDV